MTLASDETLAELVSQCEVPCERDVCEKALKYAYDLGFDEGYQSALDENEPSEEECT